MLRLVRGGVVSLIILTVMFFIAYWMSQQGTSDNKNSIEFIKAHTYNGKVVDLQNEVSVDSVKDVKWYYSKNKTITIEYGKILLKYKTEDFVTPEVQKDLQDVFITVKQHPETFELTLYFQEQEMTEYVKE